MGKQLFNVKKKKKKIKKKSKIGIIQPISY